MAILNAAETFGIPAVRPGVAEYARLRLLTLRVNRHNRIELQAVRIIRLFYLQREIAALAVRLDPAVFAREQIVPRRVERRHIARFLCC